MAQETILASNPGAAFEIGTSDRGAVVEGIQFCHDICDYGICDASCANIGRLEFCVGQGSVCCPADCSNG